VTDSELKRILIIGEVLVEIMADTIGPDFLSPQPLTGPFPSGAPAIFAAQAARLGQPVALIGSVGDDDFGRMCRDRLATEGVDIAGLGIDTDRPTGTAFVRYDASGDRHFIFNIRHSAVGRLKVTDATRDAIDKADHLHVMGSSLSSEQVVTANLDAARAIRERGGTVSFDPNLRPEIAADPGLSHALGLVLGLTDLFLPSGEELTLLTQATQSAGAVAELLAKGITAIVHKQGATGATYHDANGSVTAPALAVESVDPTGAGDCFGATFTSLWLRGTPPDDALRMANASGALAVTRHGPMEGVSGPAEIAAALGRQGKDNA
jgi:sugar/nucleoside kinase (ribokinase family)